MIYVAVPSGIAIGNPAFLPHRYSAVFVQTEQTSRIYLISQYQPLEKTQGTQSQDATRISCGLGNGLHF